MALNFPEIEKEILEYWDKDKTFSKLREKNKGKKRWSFLDGPITANNPMGVHHAWGRTYKDMFQRFFAMLGYEQRYQNGFDCQGLWVEVEVEKELGFKSKKDIEAFGVEKFVEKCKERVLKYSAIQTQQSERLGQWMDWENSYFTMSDENNYAIWGFLKKCHELGYLYKGRDSVPWCPRCGTAISQHEILTEEYKEIVHKAVYFKLPITTKFEGASFLVWTTTPWTIPANSGLMVNPDFEYGLFEGPEKLILLKDQKVLGPEYILKQTILGKDLKGIKYKAPFDHLERIKKAENEFFHTVVLEKDLVTADEGTGIVHCAPGAGEEDFKVGKEENLPVIDVIDESAVYLDDMDDLSGKDAKTHPEIVIEGLKQFLFKTEMYKHRYPTCWRCKTELVWRVVDEWYISMKKLRKPLMKITKKISWIPGFGKERELDWLKNMHDWLISKKRYWGLTLPIFECSCGHFEVIGSKEELKKRAVEGWEEEKSPHKPWMDKVKIKCLKCNEIISRIPDVGNPWLDAGIVPFSTMQYAQDKKYWKNWFPADLVCESFPGQFKNWFYSIIVMSAVLAKTFPVKTIFGYASVRDEKGEEMHKSKGNAIWFDEAVEKAGADPMRFMYAKQNPAENLKFGYANLEEAKRKLLTLHNIIVFFNTYVKEVPQNISSDNVLDKWILSRLNGLIIRTKESFSNYNAATAVCAIEDFFINDLSLWYLRRSRKRFHGEDKDIATSTMYFVCQNVLRLLAPVMPFFAEKMYQELGFKESIHLTDYPSGDKKKIDKDLEDKMDRVRDIAAQALAKRIELKIKVRQPLNKMTVKGDKLGDDLLKLIKEELNVKEVIFDNNLQTDIELDTEITDELREEGLVREFIRQVQDLRKKKGLRPEDKVVVIIQAEDISVLEKNKEFILAETKSLDIKRGEVDQGKEVDIGGQVIKISINGSSI
ncbi:isoleucine--tRNA ligase [Patescibacteria group bacterium]|nr:isoleucine--tRNA ligase [Patescibacteria group bacterium]